MIEELGFPVHANVRSKLNIQLEEDIGKWQGAPDLRKAIGEAAKSSSWFKSITNGVRWAEAVFPAFVDAVFQQKDFATKLSQFRTWVDNG
jgi:putative ATP-dependent endonuclease of OLD family